MKTSSITTYTLENEAAQFLSSLISMNEGEVLRYYLGAGSTREAYLFGKGMVIKIPRFIVRFKEGYTAEQQLSIIRKGIRQTQTELRVYQRCNPKYRYLLNPIVAHGTFLNVPFVVMPRLKIASEVVPFDVENIQRFIQWLDSCVPWTFHNDLLSFATKYRLYHSDLCNNMDNFGLDGANRIFIIDYGTKSD